MDEDGEGLTNGVIRMLGANAHTAQTYSPTWISAYAQCNRANENGVGLNAIFEDLWEANAYALIVGSFYNVS
jgi:hypothetical protein